jgi:hypothetical protein
VVGPEDLLGGEAMRFAVTEGFSVALTDDALEAHLDQVLQTLYGFGVDGNGSKPARIRGPSFNLRSVGAELVGSA